MFCFKICCKCNEIFIPALGQPAGFDFFVLLTGIALLGNRDESCVDDLAAAGLEALGAEVCLEHLEELFNHSRFTQSLPKEGDCSCIRNAVHHTKTNKLLEGTPIIYLEFKLFITNIKKLLEYKHLEKKIYGVGKQVRRDCLAFQEEVTIRAKF